MAATSGMIRSAMTYILKEQYGPQLVNLLVEETDLLKEFEKKEFDLRGNEFVVPLQVGTNEGIGAGADTTALPTAGVPTFRQGLFKSKQQRAAVRVTKESMDITKGNVGSWISAWDFSLRDATFNLRNHLDIMLYGNGTGELAHVTGNVDGTSVSGLIGNQGPEGDHYLKNGMVVDLVSHLDNGTLVGQALTVSAVTKTGFTVTTGATGYSAISGSGNGDYFVRTGTLGYNPHGLRSIINSANPAVNSNALFTTAGSYYGGLDRTDSNNVLWQGIQADLTNLDINKLNAMYDQYLEYSQPAKKLQLRTHLSTVRKLASLFFPTYMQYRTADIEGKSEVSWNELTYRGTIIKANKNCWRQDFYMYDPTWFRIGQVTPLGWLDDDGSVIKWDAGYAAFVAYLIWQMELVCEKPNSSMRGYNAETVTT